MLSATDPANPYGTTLKVAVVRTERAARRVPRERSARPSMLVDGMLAAYLARGDRQLLTWLPESEPQRSRAGRAIARVLIDRARSGVDGPRGMLIEEIDGAPPATHPMAPWLIEAGFIAGALGFQATSESRNSVVRIGSKRRASSSKLSLVGRAAFSSRISHAFASRQSRITVSGDTPSAAAVSSTVRPPKNRISTTLALRSSIFASASSASSSRDEIAARFGDHQRFVERHRLRAAAPLLIVLRPREVDEDAAHQARRHRQEMDAVLPVDLLRADQAQVGLVDQRGRLQAVPGALASHAAARDAMQLLVDERHQLLEGGFVAATPREQQAGDAAGIVWNTPS